MNNPVPLSPQELSTALELTETIMSPRFRAGGPSSSGMLNQLVQRIKNDISRLATDTTDAADQARVLSLILGAQNVGFSKMYSTLSTQLTGLLAANRGPTGGKALADMYLGQYVNSSATNAEVNPLYGQSILPARSRQNCLVIERSNGSPPAIPSDTQLLVCMQPNITSTTGVTPPADYLFGEDPYSIYALDNNSLSSWVIEDPTSTSHMAWLKIVLPSNISGAGLVNEIEIVPSPSFSFDLVSAQMTTSTQGIVDLDYSYFCGYDPSTQSVIGMGPSRFLFGQTNVSEITLGLWVTNTYGFSSIKVNNAIYQSSAIVQVDFSSLSPGGPLQNIQLYGKNPSQLSYLNVSTPSSTSVSVTLTPGSSSGETPVVTGISCNF